jgi:hypothetical protein
MSMHIIVKIYCAALVLESDKVLTAWQCMKIVYCIFSALFQYSHVPALEVAVYSFPAAEFMVLNPGITGLHPIQDMNFCFTFLLISY